MLKVPGEYKMELATAKTKVLAFQDISVIWVQIFWMLNQLNKSYFGYHVNFCCLNDFNMKLSSFWYGCTITRTLGERGKTEDHKIMAVPRLLYGSECYALGMLNWLWDSWDEFAKGSCRCQENIRYQDPRKQTNIKYICCSHCLWYEIFCGGLMMGYAGRMLIGFWQEFISLLLM